MPGKDPVEERAADIADMQVARRGRGEPYADLLGRQIAEHGKVVPVPGVPVCHCAASFDASSSSADPAPTTGLLSVPIPSTSILTTCPGSISPTPDGVPVRITSPGSKVV